MGLAALPKELIDSAKALQEAAMQLKDRQAREEILSRTEDFLGKAIAIQAHMYDLQERNHALSQEMERMRSDTSAVDQFICTRMATGAVVAVPKDRLDDAEPVYACANCLMERKVSLLQPDPHHHGMWLCAHHQPVRLSGGMTGPGASVSEGEGHF